MTQSLYYGIDVSKATLYLGSEERYLRKFNNTPSGHEALAAYLCKHHVTAIALEATGVYGMAIADALFAAGFKTYVVQPARINAYAKSQGCFAKSDPIDATLIARFAASSFRKLRVYQPRSTEVGELRELVTRRDQVVEDRKREKTRREACTSKAMLRRINKSIKALDREVDALDKLINALMKSHEELNRKRKVLEDVIGVGPQISACILAFFPELGHINRQELAALLGLAPFIRESGKWKGRRFIRGGRSRVRSALYMAAVTASTRNPVMNEFYQRLLRKGKEKKKALIAVARKMAIYLNTQMAKFLSEVPSEGRQA